MEKMVMPKKNKEPKKTKVNPKKAQNEPIHKPVAEKALPPIPETSKIHNIKYLTCQGGGMKGIGFVTAVEELEKQGVLSQLEEVAGSSAGAIFATLVAVGYTAAEIREKMMELDFRELLDKDKTFWDKLPFSKAGEGIEAIAGAVEKASSDPKKLSKVLATPIHYLGKAVGVAGKAAKGLLSLPGTATTAAKLLVGEETGVAKGEALLDLVSEMIAAKTGNPNATFNDLAKLADATDGKFKKLILTGSNLTPRKGEDRLVYFKQGGKYGDMPIRDAVRISAGFPGAFKATPLIDPDGHVNTMVDGGLMENLPDVFNKPPYWDGPEGSVNPKCFALSFETPPPPPGTKQKVPKNLKGVALGCLESLTDESPLKKKYGHFLANISTKGVGTLEFDASEERRLNLANSGGEAVRAAFRKILEAEQREKLDYGSLSKLSLDELVRLEVALDYENPAADHPNSSIRLDIKKILEEREIKEQAEIDKLRLQEKHILDRRLKIEGKRALSDGELVSHCQEKIKIFNNRLNMLHEQRDFLRDVKVSLEFREAVIGAKLKHLGISEDVEKDLKSLEEMQKALQRNRDEHASLGLDEEFEQRRQILEGRFKNLLEEKQDLFAKIKNKYKNDDLMSKFVAETESEASKWGYGGKLDRQSLEVRLGQDGLVEKLTALAALQDKIRDIRIEYHKPGITEDRKQALTKEYEELLLQKQTEFNKIKNEYQGKDELLYQYFDDLEKESNQSWNFKIPITLEAVKNRLHKDVVDCDKDLKKVDKLIKSFEKRQIVLDKYANNAFSHRADISERYKGLLNLKQALDITIDRTTVPFVEWISKFVDKRPGRENSLKNWGIRAAAGLSFLTWTVGLTAATGGLALIGFGITAAIKKFGNPKMKAAARGVLDWFSWHDPVVYAKTKELREVAAGCVNVLNESFGNNIYACEAVYKPFAEYFLQSGIRIEDLKPKLNEDPDKAKERIQKLQGKMEVLVNQMPKEELDVYKKFESFAKDVLRMSQEKRTQTLEKELTAIETRFAKDKDKPLSKLEISKYVTALNMLKKENPNFKHEIPKELQEQHKDAIESLQKSPTLLHQVSKVPTSKPAPAKDEVLAQDIAQKGEAKVAKDKRVDTAVTFLAKKAKTVKPTLESADHDAKRKPPSSP